MPCNDVLQAVGMYIFVQIRSDFNPLFALILNKYFCTLESIVIHCHTTMPNSLSKNDKWFPVSTTSLLKTTKYSNVGTYMGIRYTIEATVFI